MGEEGTVQVLAAMFAFGFGIQTIFWAAVQIASWIRSAVDEL